MNSHSQFLLLYFHFILKITHFILLTGKRAAVLVAKGTVDIILRVIVNTSKEASVCEEILLLSHVILTKVGPKGMFLPIQNDTVNLTCVILKLNFIYRYKCLFSLCRRDFIMSS